MGRGGLWDRALRNRAARDRNGFETHAVGRKKPHSRVLALVLAAATLLSGCGVSGISEMPLPGGADTGDNPYQVRVHFKDVLDLVPNAGVRVNNVPVGWVQAVGLAPKSWEAEATLEVKGSVRLPANAIARVRQSSLLGEKYVELAAPSAPEIPRGKLRDGSLIGIERTGRNPEVEEVLGALSLLLNGGGVAQLQNITKELNAALAGREGDVRGALHNLDKLVAGLDAQRSEITRALDGVNRLSARLNNQRGDIDTALRDLEPGLRVLSEQRGQLVTMLRSLDKLSGVATNVVNRSQDDLVHNLRALQPTLHQLAKAGASFPKSLELLFTFPFTDGTVNGVRGDYTNLYVDVNMNLTTILGNIGRSRQPLVQGSAPAPPDPSTPALPLPPLLPPREELSPPLKKKPEPGLFDFLQGGS